MPKNSLADFSCSNADSEDSAIGNDIEPSTTTNVINLPLAGSANDFGRIFF